MNKVYVVTAGEYSDYRICGVFSSDAKARAFIDHEFGPDESEHPYGNDPGVEVWDVDPEFDTSTGCYVASYSTLGPWSNSQLGIRWDSEARVTSPPITLHGRAKPYVLLKGYGATPEHARRSCSELMRAVKAGTVVVDGWNDVDKIDLSAAVCG